MVVEKRVLMNVVFPKPDSPATCTGINSSVKSITLVDRELSHHYSEGSTSLRNNLVSMTIISPKPKALILPLGDTVDWEAKILVSTEAPKWYRESFMTHIGDANWRR